MDFHLDEISVLIGIAFGLISGLIFMPWRYQFMGKEGGVLNNTFIYLMAWMFASPFFLIAMGIVGYSKYKQAWLLYIEETQRRKYQSEEL